MMMPEEGFLVLRYGGYKVHAIRPENFNLMKAERFTVCFLHPDIEFSVDLSMPDFIRRMHALACDGLLPTLPADWFETVAYDHWFTIYRPARDRIIRPEGEIASTPPAERLDWLIELPSEDGKMAFAPLAGVLNALLQAGDEGYLPPLPEGWFEEALPTEHRQDFDRVFEAKGRWLRQEGEDPLQALLGDKLSPLPLCKELR